MNREQIEQIKQRYPAGTRIMLEHMVDEPYPVPPGTRGSVSCVDDIGQIHMHWDNGRTLPVMPWEDTFRKLTAQELAEEQSSQRHDTAEVCAAIRDYMVFEEETSTVYPFALTYDELSKETVSTIAQKCRGYTDTETIHTAIEEVVGTNPILSCENKDGIAEMQL